MIVTDVLHCGGAALRSAEVRDRPLFEMDSDELLYRLSYNYGVLTPAQREMEEEARKKAQAEKAKKKQEGAKAKAAKSGSSAKAGGGKAGDKASMRTSFMDTALHVFKVRGAGPLARWVVFRGSPRSRPLSVRLPGQGATVAALELPTGGSTSAFKFEKDQTFRLTIVLGDKVRRLQLLAPQPRYRTRADVVPPRAVRSCARRS